MMEDLERGERERERERERKGQVISLHHPPDQDVRVVTSL